MKTSIKTKFGTPLYSNDNVITELEVGIPGTWPTRTVTVRFWVDEGQPHMIRTNCSGQLFVQAGNNGSIGIIPKYRNELDVEGDNI
tara:strand:+ start:486 stop:743 length:258 start_codon:yes stop_codon:yes gene_type:complete